MQWLCQLKPKSQFKSCSNSQGGLNFIWKRYNVWAWRWLIAMMIRLVCHPLPPFSLIQFAQNYSPNSQPGSRLIQSQWELNTHESDIACSQYHKKYWSRFQFLPLFCGLWEIECINAIKQPQQYIVRHRSQLEPQDILPWTTQQPVIWKRTGVDI